MMWRILNKIFGWDYIAWENTCDSGVARIQRDANGKVYFWQYKSTKCVGRMEQIVLWLTCKPNKYGKPND